MHDLKKVRNKACVEDSIYKTYIIQKNFIFCSFYFEPNIQTKLTQVSRNDDRRDVELMGCLSIFCHPGGSFGLNNS